MNQEIHRIIMMGCLVLVLGSMTGCQRQAAWFGDLQGDRIRSLVTDELAKGSFPGAVILVGQHKTILFKEAFGLQMIDPNEVPMNTDTVFDLASMTKPMATGASVMVLIDQGNLKPDDYVKQYLPAFACAGKETVQIRHLLTHTSGLPAYTNAKTLADQHGNPCAQAVVDTICGLEAQNAPGERIRYSCLGYIILAQIIQQVSGQDINVFATENLYGPLRMKHTRFRPPDAWIDNVAATEVVEGTCIRGTVHDPLARLREGLSGNAGLFSTADDVARFCQMLLNKGRAKRRAILSEEAVHLMTEPQSHGRGFGFDLASSYAWITGDHASDRTFCHSGYTGTSVVCDPVSGIYLIILTNRAHPHDKGTVRALRKGVANIVFGAHHELTPKTND
jgi:serine-type D-Ala-D-Ala carboxypeptidase